MGEEKAIVLSIYNANKQTIVKNKKALGSFFQCRYTIFSCNLRDSTKNTHKIQKNMFGTYLKAKHDVSEQYNVVVT